MMGISLFLTDKVGGRKDDDSIDGISFVVAIFWPILLPIGIGFSISKLFSKLIKKEKKND